MIRPMNTSARFTLGWATAALAFAMAAGSAWAGSGDAPGERDHDRALRAVQAGEVMPLPQLLERLGRSHPGQVMEVELEYERGRWIYEIRLLRPDGQLSKLMFDAKTGDLLQIKSRAGRER